MSDDGELIHHASAWAATAHVHPVPTLLIDDRRLVVDANRAATTLFETPSAELVGVALEELMISEGEPDPNDAMQVRPVRVHHRGQWLDRVAQEFLLEGDYRAVLFTAPGLLEPSERPVGPSLAQRVAADAAADAARLHASPVDLIRRILERGAQELDGSMIVALPDGTGVLRPVAVADPSGLFGDSGRPALPSILGRAFTDGVAVEATGGLAIGLGSAASAGPAVAVPVAAGGKEVGALALVRGSGKAAVSLDEVAAVHAIADHLALLQALRRADESTEQIEAAATDMSLFASALAHDLRAPIRHVSAFATLAREDLPEGTDESVRANLDRVIQAAERASGQLDDLVSYIRGVDPDFEDVSMQALVDRVLQPLLVMFEDAGAVVSVELTDDDIVFTDPAVAAIVLENLLENAVKYRNPAVPLEIRIHASSGPLHRHLHVSDNGLGVPEQKEDTVFHAFRRLHPEVAEGSGMGLAISRRVARLVDGDLTLKRLDAGTRFTLTLPRSD